MKTLKLDWSSWSRALDCQRKGWMLIMLKREPDFTSPALTFGKAIHAALDTWQQALHATREDLQLAMEESAAKVFASQEPSDDFRTLGKAKEVIGEYVSKYWDSDQTFDVLGSELALERELGEIQVNDSTVRVIWQGRLDGLWFDRTSRQVSVKDTKTSSRSFEQHGEFGGPGRDAVRFQSSGQFLGYCFLASEPDRPVRQVILDHITVRPPLQRPTAKSPPRIALDRAVFNYSSEQIESWKRDTLIQVQQFLQACEQAPPPMNRNSCAWPTVCGYWSACEQRTEADRMRWLQSGRFRDHTFDPMRKEPSE